jgi:hypothetical protein
MAFPVLHTLSFPWPVFRAGQVLEKPMCRHPVQYAALGARCSSASHRLSVSALTIRLFIETTSQVIDLSELPVIR